MDGWRKIRKLALVMVLLPSKCSSGFSPSIARSRLVPPFPVGGRIHSTTWLQRNLSSEQNQDPAWNSQEPAEPTGDSKDESPGPTKHSVTWTTAEGTVHFDAWEGELLRTAALRRGVVSPHNGRATFINCRGLGTCGTCAVEVEGRVASPDRNPRERLRLSLPPHNPKRQSPRLRLACQIQVQGDLCVTKRSGFWGQSDSLAPSSVHPTHFGSLEYLLDGKSPDPPTTKPEAKDSP